MPRGSQRGFGDSSIRPYGHGWTWDGCMSESIGLHQAVEFIGSATTCHTRIGYRLDTGPPEYQPFSSRFTQQGSLRIASVCSHMSDPSDGKCAESRPADRSVAGHGAVGATRRCAPQWRRHGAEGQEWGATSRCALRAGAQCGGACRPREHVVEGTGPRRRERARGRREGQGSSRAC